MQIKTDFSELEPAIAYLKEIAPQVASLAEAKESSESEKRRILANKDEILAEKKSLQDELSKTGKELADIKAKGGENPDLEARYRSLYEQDKAEFQQRLEAIEAEREQEKQSALKERRDSAIISELSQPSYGIINPKHFLKLHGDRVELDPDTGELYVDMGDYKRQPVKNYVEDIAQRPDEQHLFKPKGGKGNDSPGAGDGGGQPSNNPWNPKTFNLTEQSRIFRDNPALAARLKAEAGKA